MNRLSKSTLGGLALAAAVMAAPAASAQASSPDVGDAVTYKFRSAPFGGMGATSLDEFKGRPVLVEFWGTR